MIRSFILKIFNFFGIGRDFNHRIAERVDDLIYDPVNKETTFKSKETK